MNASRLATVLLVILVAASVLFVFGREDETATPSATNTKASGLAAFAELLRRDGYQVTLDRSPRLRRDPQEIVLAAEIYARSPEPNPFGQPSEDPVQTQTQNSLERHTGQGGRLVVLHLPSLFDTTQTTPETDVFENRLTGQEFTVSTYPFPPAGENPYFPSEEDPFFLLPDPVAPEKTIPLLENEERDFAYIAPDGQGWSLHIITGAAATNRYIGENQNAEALLFLIRRFAPPGSTIVFAESSLGNAGQPSLLREIGPWAVAALWQAFLLLAVLAYTLGRRFGLPVAEPVVAQGARELLDAMSVTLARAKRRDHALFTLLDQAYERIQKAARAPAGSSPSDLGELAHPALAAVITRIRTRYGTDVPKKEAVTLAQDLERELQTFESQERARRAPQ